MKNPSVHLLSLWTKTFQELMTSGCTRALMEDASAWRNLSAMMKMGATMKLDHEGENLLSTSCILGSACNGSRMASVLMLLEWSNLTPPNQSVPANQNHSAGLWDRCSFWLILMEMAPSVTKNWTQWCSTWSWMVHLTCDQIAYILKTMKSALMSSITAYFTASPLQATKI